LRLVRICATAVAMPMSGTEHRDEYRTFRDATADVPSASKASFAVGPAKTSSLIGLPWVEGVQQQAPSWVKTVWAPVGLPPSAHYRPSSSDYGSMPTSPYHMHASFEKAKPATSVRYLQAPYLTGEMAEGAGIDARPVSSVSTFSLSSERQAAILAGGQQRLGERMAETAVWTMNRSLRSSPILAVPDPYVTSTNASFQQRAPADSQQHRLRSFVTSAYVPARTLDSTPAYCAVPPLSGSQTLHATRFLGVRDSDGGRRLIEMDTTGAPVPTAPWKLPPTRSSRQSPLLPASLSLRSQSRETKKRSAQCSTARLTR